MSLAKRRGFFFQSSEIYGGIQGIWDFGPLGVALRNNIKRAWWRSMVELRDDVVGIDAGIIMNPQGLGRLGARAELHRPAGRMQEMPPALPRRPGRAGPATTKTAASSPRPASST